MDTILTVKNEDLKFSDPVKAVEFFQELLYAETVRIGVPLKNINISNWINIPDGGIDASIRTDNIPKEESFIQKGQNSYQIKTGEDFSPWQKAKIRKELFGKKSPDRQNLGESVRHCLDEKGTYGLICFGKNLTVDQQRKARGHLDSFFKECGYREFHVDVWSLNNLISFLRPFPSLALRVNGNHKGMFETHAMWASHADMESAFLAGEEQESLISSIREELLRQDDMPVQIHIWGEPGIGKTRLVMEATAIADLRPFVIYSTADNFNNSELQSLLQQGTFHAVLVLEECDSRSRQALWNKLKCHRHRIKLLSLYDEPVQDAGLQSFKVPPLEEKHISAIIQIYIKSQIRANHWAKECEGSPKVAHVIGQHLMMDSENILQSLKDIWERYITGSDDKHSLKIEQRWRALRFLALFKRFGYGRPVVKETEAIWNIIHQADQTITWAAFQEVVGNLRQRILRGTYTLHITPKLLHVTLWIDWWDLYGERFPFDTLLSLPEPLREWSFEMFEYASGSPVASSYAKKLLGKDGIFQKTPQIFNTESGAKFFEALAKAEPEAALRCLQNTIGLWSKETLFSHSTGRTSIVWALEKIAIRKDLFVDAARLLLDLAEVEDERHSNHASGIVVSFFYISWHQDISPTEASPQERFPVLKEAVESDSKRRRLLGLQACDRALRHDFAGPATDIYHIFGKEPQLWKPATWGELFDAYRQVWHYLFQTLDSLPEDEQQKAGEILIENAHQLARIENLTIMVIDTIDALSQKPYADPEKILDKVLWILRREKLSDEARSRWEQIKDRLTGSDFHALLKRYVGMRISEDHFDDEGQQSNSLQKKIEQLAQEAISTPEILDLEFSWLVTADAQNSYYFGYALAIRDASFLLLPTILDIQKGTSDNASLAFLGGYLRAVFERDRLYWDKLLASFVTDERLNHTVPELTFRSGRISDTAAIRILQLVKDQIVDFSQLRMFVYGESLQELSEAVFQQWIEGLVSQKEVYAIHIALDLYHAYYLRGRSSRSLPEYLTFRILTHPSLFQKPDGIKHEQRSGHDWEAIAKIFIKNFPEKRLLLADILLEHFGEDGSPICDSSGFASPAQVILAELIQQEPGVIWARIARYLESPRNGRAFELTHWLKGFGSLGEDEEGNGVSILFPAEIVWDWVDGNIEKRAQYLATFLPKRLFRDEHQLCWARELLIRYGNRKEVRNHLLDSFLSYGWTGSQRVYLKKKIQELLAFKQQEENENVRQWLDEYVAALEHDLEQVKIEEERRDF